MIVLLLRSAPEFGDSVVRILPRRRRRESKTGKLGRDPDIAGEITSRKALGQASVMKLEPVRRHIRDMLLAGSSPFLEDPQDDGIGKQAVENVGVFLHLLHNLIAPGGFQGIGKILDLIEDLFPFLGPQREEAGRCRYDNSGNDETQGESLEIARIRSKENSDPGSQKNKTPTAKKETTSEKPKWNDL